MKPFFYILFLFGFFYSCNPSQPISTSKKNTLLTTLVNPFIGTGGHGHTYPGASLPFGMMQLSPDTRLKGWDGCSGYHYNDEYIYGFSHTHLSGTGVSDYGDILLMPTNAVYFKQPSKNYRYVKIIAKKLGKLPKWHLGYEHDGRSWIFVDEITIK